MSTQDDKEWKQRFHETGVRDCLYHQARIITDYRCPHASREAWAVEYKKAVKEVFRHSKVRPLEED